tara:strand:+ start:35 stop:328 length:294 start_codon:yes stop_codon:yes gene_type:complete
MTKERSGILTKLKDSTHLTLIISQGWICSTGYRSCIIREPDGSIKRSYSCGDIPLGNIETGFKLFDEPKVCITDACVSSADSKIPKRKLSSELPLWK